MRRLSVRRSSVTDLAFGAAGLGLGLALGFLLRGLVGGVDRRRLKSLVGEVTGQYPAGSGMPREAGNQITAALAGDESLRDLDFDVVTVRIGQVELHGWVPSRRLSARAMRLAREAAPGTDVVNRLKVRGEDEPPVRDESEERQPA